MKFRYQQKHGKYLPIIPIRLRSVEGEWITFDAYVDSGATYSIFTEEIGEILGIDVEKGDKIHITVGDGSLITAYLHSIEVWIGEYEFSAIVGFSKHLGIGFNILGRAGFFDRFRICFDEIKRTVEFL